MANQISVPSTSNVMSKQGGTSTTSVGVDESCGIKSSVQPRTFMGCLHKTEGPLHCDKGLLYSLQQGLSNQSLGASVFGSGQELVSDLTAPIELTAADMSLSTLYLHELHHRQVSY